MKKVVEESSSEVESAVQRGKEELPSSRETNLNLPRTRLE